MGPKFGFGQAVRPGVPELQPGEVSPPATGSVPDEPGTHWAASPPWQPQSPPPGEEHRPPGGIGLHRLGLGLGEKGRQFMGSHPFFGERASRSAATASSA